MNTNVFLHHAEEVKRKRHGERRRSISESQKRAMMLGSRVHHHQSYGGGQALIKQPATSSLLRTSPTKSEYEDFDRESSLTSGSSNEVVVVATDKNSKFDQLHSVRYKLEHNQLSRTTSEADKVRAFRILDEHLTSPDWEVKQFAVQLVHDILPHVGSDALDHCMAEVLPNLIPCLGSAGISIRKAAIQAVHIYLRFTSDISSVLKAIVSYGLDQPDQNIVHEILISIPLLFPEDFDDSYRGVRNLFHLVSGLARKLVPEDTRLPAFMSLQRLADVVGVKQFQAYLNKLTGDQKKIYDELSTIRPSQSIKLNNNDFDDSMNGGGGLVMIHGRKVSTTQFAPTGGWFEYGAIDDSIIEKLRDEEDVRVRLSGADELNRAVKSMKDLTPLLPQMRLFLTFMDSVLEGEHNFKMVLLVLETYGVLIDRMRHKVKPHLRSLCTALLRHASNTKIVVRIENYRVIKKLMLVAKPNIVLTHFFDHLGDKRSMVREDVLNIVMYALLTFPSNEFDLKNIAATVVPTLVDPKRRVRQASQECVAILAAFMGPTKAAPLIRSIELLESHFERGTGVLNAVQARLSRRQLPRITQDGLVEYSLQVPCSASIGLQRSRGTSRRGRSESPVHAKKYGADIEWILAGTGSVSSGSAKSVSTCRSESRLDESFSSSNSFPNSPITARRTASPLLSTIESAATTVVSTDPLQRKTPVAIHGTGFLKAAKSEDTISSSKTSRRSSILEENSTNSSSDNNENNKRLPNLEEASSGHAGGKAAGVSGNKGGCVAGSSSSQGAKGKNVNEAPAASSSTSSSELPRLTGTKSQASTASSSATRDSGISVNDVQKAAEEALKNKRTSSNVSSSNSVAASRRASKVSLNRGSRTSSSRSNVSNNRASGMISVDDLPIAGRAMPLGRRPGTNKSLTSNFDSGLDSRSTLGTAASSRQQNEHIAYSRSISSGSSSVKPNGFLKNSASLHQQLASHGTTLTKKAVSETVIHQRSRDEVTPPRSPLLVVESNKAAHLLLRPADNSPFTSTPATIHGLHHVSNQSNASTNSTPFSQISVPSSYEYEDDFTSESESEVSLLPAAMLPTIPHHSYQLPNSIPTADKRSAHSQRTVKSTNSSGSSRIPIKRNSSLRRQSSNKTGNHQSREVMHSYKNSGTDDGEEEPQTLVIEDPTELSVPPASPSKPLSQAEFDDMPLPASRSASSKACSSQDQGLPRTAGEKAASRKQQPSKNIESRPPNVSVQKRPFLQRRTSPNKIINKNTTPSSTAAVAAKAATTTNATVTKARVGNFARSPPSKRVHKSVESTRTSIGKVTSSKTPSTLRSNKSSIIHKSTPNLSSTPSASTASFNKASTVEVTRSSSHGRTTSSHNFEDIQEQQQQQSIANDNNGYSLGLLEADAVAEAAEDNLIEANAIPFVNPVNKIARTPPTMTRKVISVVGNPEPDDYMVEPFTNGTNGFIPKSSVKENLPPLDNEFGLEHHHHREEPLLNKAASSSSSAVQQQAPNSSTYSRAAVAPGTAASTASSVSVSNLHFLALKTQVTLKSPLEGHNLGPFHKPEEFLQRTLDNLSSDDWEANVNGMAGVLRFARHHPEYLLVEYKPLLQLVMKHVKNLRSQVCRTAVMVVGELFTQLKRNIEPELEKVMMPLILKSGDTNKFLREDCNVTLDAIVENSSPAKIILIVTAEAVFHKSPVVRTTVSRLLAYTVERMGVHKALSGGKDITEKLLPAVAKLAQDGSPDARNYSKSCLHRMLHEHPDCEKILKKSLTSNTMRNLEKIIEALKNGKANHTNGFSSRGSRGSRRGGNSRKTL